MFTFLIGILAGCCTIAAYVPYIISTVSGKTQPHRVTRFNLCVVGVALLVSNYLLGARDTLFVAMSQSVGPFIILLLSVRYGTGGKTALERIAMVSAVALMILAFLLTNTVVVLISGIAADFFGIVFTFIKIWRNPRSEDRTAWRLWFFGSALNLLAVSQWHSINSIYPLYIFCTNGALLLIQGVALQRNRKQHSAQ